MGTKRAARRKPVTSTLGVDPVRRTPLQGRAQTTVDAILDATRILMLRHGVDGLSTNAVARLAGVSIGSLYQYFPSKRALIGGLRLRHQERGACTFAREASELADAPVELAIRRLVDGVLAMHREEPELHRQLELNGRREVFGPIEQRIVCGLAHYFEGQRDALAVQNLERAARVVVLALEAVTHGMIVSEPEALFDEHWPRTLRGCCLPTYSEGRSVAAHARHTPTPGVPDPSHQPSCLLAVYAPAALRWGAEGRRHRTCSALPWVRHREAGRCC